MHMTGMAIARIRQIQFASKPAGKEWNIPQDTRLRRAVDRRFRMGRDINADERYRIDRTAAARLQTVDEPCELGLCEAGCGRRAFQLAHQVALKIVIGCWRTWEPRAHIYAR